MMKTIYKSIYNFIKRPPGVGGKTLIGYIENLMGTLQNWEKLGTGLPNIIKGKDNLSSYKFNTNIAEHFFCKTVSPTLQCSVQPK